MNALPPFVALETTAAHQRLRALASRWPQGPWRYAGAHDPAHAPGKASSLPLLGPVGAWRLSLSRQPWDEAVRTGLLALAQETHLTDAIAALFAGAPLNFTEKRPALHMACRGGAEPPTADAARFQEAETLMQRFVAAYHSGQLTNAEGDPFTAVVNIGIGGSDVGPRLVADALAHWGYPLRGILRFVANLDPSDFVHATAGLDPRTTLFVVTSKSFGTAETLSNLALARAWLASAWGRDDPATLNRHFIAITSAPKKALAHGFDADRVLWLPEWVGGRYSVWSAVGLPVALAFGGEVFAQLRAGARLADAHFRSAALTQNLPVWAGLLGVWLSTYLHYPQTAVLPYAQGLAYFPAWLQQLEMESNGKAARRDGSSVPYATAMAVWGMSGTLGQHAFHQWFYQGTQRIALEFIVLPARCHSRDDALRPLCQSASMATAKNALAQAQALWQGRSAQDAEHELRRQGFDAAQVAALVPHLVIPGGQPSSVWIAERADAEALGTLLALYEHATFVRGWVWGIDPFDQFGVELGKAMARALEANDNAALDSVTAAMLAVLARS